MIISQYVRFELPCPKFKKKKREREREWHTIILYVAHKSFIKFNFLKGYSHCTHFASTNFKSSHRTTPKFTYLDLYPLYTLYQSSKTGQNLIMCPHMQRRKTISSSFSSLIRDFFSPPHLLSAPLFIKSQIKNEPKKLNKKKSHAPISVKKNRNPLSSKIKTPNFKIGHMEFWVEDLKG